jgi:hypothetical protein
MVVAQPLCGATPLEQRGLLIDGGCLPNNRHDRRSARVGLCEPVGKQHDEFVNTGGRLAALRHEDRDGNRSIGAGCRVIQDRRQHRRLIAHGVVDRLNRDACPSRDRANRGSDVSVLGEQIERRRHDLLAGRRGESLTQRRHVLSPKL